MGIRDGWGRVGQGRRVRRTAKQVFGWDDLRPGQGEAIQHLLKGRDVLVVMPTGSGKSATYQIPAQLLDGPTIVISPLIALQRDQMLRLAGQNAGGAVVVNSAQRAGGRPPWSRYAPGRPSTSSSPPSSSPSPTWSTGSSRRGPR